MSLLSGDIIKVEISKNKLFVLVVVQQGNERHKVKLKYTEESKEVRQGDFLVCKGTYALWSMTNGERTNIKLPLANKIRYKKLRSTITPVLHPRDQEK